MRQTCKKLKVDAEYRWFLGIPFGQDTPHFSTFSKNYERRFKDSKNNHGYRYAMYRGLEKNQNYTWLICAAQNMKIISIRNDIYGKKPKKSSYIIDNILNFIQNSNLFKKIYIKKPLEKNSRGLSTI